MEIAVVTIVSGFLAGRLATVWAAWLVRRDAHVGIVQCAVCSRETGISARLLIWPERRCPGCGGHAPGWSWMVPIATALLFAAFAWMLQQGRCQNVDEVQPTGELWTDRLPYHLLLVFLLITATLTDFFDYVIPDAITLPGMLLGIGFAAVSGDLEMIHIWVDWSDPIQTSIHGAELPDWIRIHQHLHGLAWSTAGALTGGGLVWAHRLAAHRILGYPAIGFGDVTLMAMAGAFVGWQPILCALAVAPFCAAAGGLCVRLLSGRTFVALGPYLAAGTIFVLFRWQWLWVQLSLRQIFSHPPTLIGIIGGSFVAFMLLLLALRIFLAVPARSMRR